MPCSAMDFVMGLGACSRPVVKAKLGNPEPFPVTLSDALDQIQTAPALVSFYVFSITKSKPGFTLEQLVSKIMFLVDDVVGEVSDVPFAQDIRDELADIVSGAKTIEEVSLALPSYRAEAQPFMSSDSGETEARRKAATVIYETLRAIVHRSPLDYYRFNREILFSYARYKVLKSSPPLPSISDIMVGLLPHLTMSPSERSAYAAANDLQP